MDNKPSFTERIARLKACAYELHAMLQHGRYDPAHVEKAAEIMLSEAQHMEAATKRFAARKFSPKKREDVAAR